MQRTLPETFGMVEPVLRMHIRHTAVEIFIDGISVFSYGLDRISENKSVGSGFQFPVQDEHCRRAYDQCAHKKLVQFFYKPAAQFGDILAYIEEKRDRCNIETEGEKQSRSVFIPPKTKCLPNSTPYGSMNGKMSTAPL